MNAVTSLNRTAIAKLLLLVAALALGLALPYLVSGFILATATLALVYGLFAMSIGFMAGYGGLVSLGQAGIMGVAAYGVGYIATHTSGGHLQQILTGLGAGMAAALLFGVMAMRTSGVYFLMVTLAQGMMVWGLASTLQPITNADNGLVGVYRPPFVERDWQYYYLVLAVVVLCSGLLWVVSRSPFGLALRGLRESESRLRMLGYNTTAHRLYAFLVAGFFATIAGVLFAYNNQFVSPSVAEFALSAQGVLMAILGGIESLVGPLIGSIVIVYVQNVVSIRIDRWPTFMGLIFIFMVLFARDGFVGAVRRIWYSTIARGEATPESRAAGGPVATPGREPTPVPEPVQHGGGRHDG